MSAFGLRIHLLPTQVYLKTCYQFEFLIDVAILESKVNEKSFI